MTIAILGAGGQLGRELARQWGESAISLTRADADLARPDQLEAVLEELAPGVVVNAAAYTRVDDAERDAGPAWEVNARGVERLAALCRRLGARLVHISTDYVFGGVGAEGAVPAARHVPYGEDEPPCPANAYGRSKLAGEEAARACPGALVIRTCGLYGPPADALPGVPGSGNFVETMLRLGRTRDRVRVVDDQQCSPTSAADLTRAMTWLVERRASGLLHVVNGPGCGWHDFAAAIFRLAGLSTIVEPIRSSEFGAAAPRPAYSVLSTARYEAAGGPPLAPTFVALEAYLRGRGF